MNAPTARFTVLQALVQFIANFIWQPGDFAAPAQTPRPGQASCF